MVVVAKSLREPVSKYAGLRMSADKYLSMPEDGFIYQLIDGVVVTAPSSTPEHQDVRGEIEHQLRGHAGPRKLGWVLSEVDVRLGPRLVYRPDLLFISAANREARPNKIDFPPEMIVEVLSPSSTFMDLETKRNDYAKFGVCEYWIVDPWNGSVIFLRLNRGKFIEVLAHRGRFMSKAVSGFSLSLKAVRGVCARPSED